MAHTAHDETGGPDLARSVVFHGRECRLSRVGIELFERAVAGGGQLLRAEAALAGDSATRVSRLLLTFDVGRVLVRAEPATGSLAIDYVVDSDEAPPALTDVSEEEPWWRVLGQPLARAWPVDDAGGSVCIQFRADDQNPRLVSLEARGGAVAIRLEAAPE